MCMRLCKRSGERDVLWDVVFVICMIYGSMRDMVVKDSKTMRLQSLEEL